jgi:hypothetical protein
MTSPAVSAATQSDALGQAIESAPAAPTPLDSLHADAPAAGSAEVRTLPFRSLAAQNLVVGHDSEEMTCPGSRPVDARHFGLAPFGLVEVSTSFDGGCARELERTTTQKVAVGHETSPGATRSVPDALI